MCILCVIQKWSRRVATMLPWLVIPLIGLWAFSQFLPPAFRFEITSPRLACVFVLLITLFWYEILMPQLSAWRVRRNALLRERKRFEAIELQKLRKTATRRCRNCLTPYRDQNPGGGRFMCSYCGHISKRPVLDLPVPPGIGISNSGVIKDLVGKSGKILNGKVWVDNGWMCGHDWLENGNCTGCTGDSIPGKSAYWKKNGSDLFGDENCLAEKSYSSIVIFSCKILTYFLLSIRWLWRKIFRVSSSREDASSNTDHKGMLAKRGENGGNFHKSRGEKARRKAEGKRQARLEKELLEEEERKQREEVARLVEERRRLRDEKMEAEKDCGKSSPTMREKDRKKEAERKRQERRKDKVKGSSKSSSDVEELEKKTGKESERKREFYKKSDIHPKSVTDNVNCQTTETRHRIKNTSANNFIRENAGASYLDRMRGTFLSSSKAFSGGSFFGRGTNTAASMTKESKSNNSDHAHIAGYRRDSCPFDRVAVKPVNGEDKNIKRAVHCEPQSSTAPKKSWQQLFTRSSSVPPSISNVISRPTSKFQVEPQSPKFSGQAPSIQSFDNPINFGLPSPFTISSYFNGSPSSSLGFSPAIEPIYPRVKEGSNELVQEELELFEDPCYIPDPVSLLGPVSESLDNFQLDLGPGFETGMGLKRTRTLKNVSVSLEVNKPSPIESPMSREKHNNFGRFSTTPKTQDMHTSPVESANEMGTWKMWHTCPLGHDDHGLVGGTASWHLPPELNRSNKDDFVQLSSHKTMASLFTKEEKALSSTQCPKNIFVGNAQNGGVFSPVTASSDPDPWLQKAFFSPLSAGENHFVPKVQEETNKNEMLYRSPNRSSVNLPFGNGWSKSEWAVQDTGEDARKLDTGRPHVGGLFPTPDVQSLWSFE